MKHFFYLHYQSAKQALIKILRQPFGSLLNLLMLSIALALPLTLFLTLSSIQDWAGRLAATPQITLYMERSAEEADIAAVSNTLHNHPKVQSFVFMSKGQALKDMENRNGLQGLTEGLGSNPLPDAFIVTPATLEPHALEMLQKELSGLPMVESAQFDANWAKRLFAILQLGQQLTWLLAIVLGIALVLVTHNTISMQILARKDEIDVTKLIGATDSFIRRPFMYHALWQGLLAGLIAWGLTCWLIIVANPVIRDFAQLYNEQIYLRALAPLELAIFLGATALLSIVGARLAADHHLHRIQPG